MTNKKLKKHIIHVGCDCEEEKIKAYWIRINEIEERIQKLSNKGVDYFAEEVKRKSLINNVRRLEREK